jgi:RNA polymerase sigma-70 factor (ECF subfamily)
MTRFPDTRGSLVAAAKSDDGETRARALETLAEAYWRPVYTYVRLKAGRDHEEASDLTQEFFARLVEKDWLERFDASKARLRTYLRVLVDGLAANESKARNRLKRGGGIKVLSLDFEAVRREVEERRREGDLSPEDFFEREWARSVFSLAVTRLRDRYTTSGHEKRFGLFSAFDLEESVGSADARPTYQELALRFGTTVVDVTNQLSAARRDFRRILLDLLRELTVSDAEFRAEARALLGVEPPA